MSQLERLCERRPVLRVSCKYEGTVTRDGNWQAHEWKVTLRYERRRLTVPFFQGMGHSKEPSAADVISCLCSDARAGEEPFEEFCSNFGYDSDSRKAWDTWKACERMGTGVRRLLGDSFDTFANAEH